MNFNGFRYQLLVFHGIGCCDAILSSSCSIIIKFIHFQKIMKNFKTAISSQITYQETDFQLHNYIVTLKRPVQV